jgi:predicted Rossmann-fold nucleotide-binding protein
MVLMGVEFWEPITHFVTESLIREATIDPEDRELFYMTDHPDEAVGYVLGRLSS